MLQEMKLEDALKKFLQGKKVLVMYDETREADKPEFTVEPLEEMLKRNRFLVEVPAVENPDFKEAVHQMVTPEKLLPQEPVREEPEVAPMENNKNLTRKPRGYAGFLHIRCEHCGKTKTFCAKHQLSYYGCKECGKKTDLKDLKLAFINCECGGTARYFTNETAELIELNCINCGMPVALKYNAKKKLYETIRS